jgi:O-antigen/teichoic acid export membrane protein
MTAGQRRDVRRQLLRFGGWISVSGVISPLMLQSDRFAIAAILSASAVATYTLPYELIVQSLVIVGAICTVAFPSITRMLHQDAHACLRMFHRWTLGTTAFMAVTAGVMAAVLPTFLPWWVGNAISPDSVLAGQILCIGVLANALGSMHYALLHAMGKSRQTALLHLFEFSMYAVAMPMLIHAWGIVGAALAWTGRMVVDAGLLVIATSVEVRRPEWKLAAVSNPVAMAPRMIPQPPLAATRQSTP